MPKVAGKSVSSRIQIIGCIPGPRDEARRQMTDIVDSQTRSRMMSGIRGKNTKPELALRQSLHALGFRFRLHVKGLPGKPDIVMPKYRAVIFVHGCFWHRHPECEHARMPKSRLDFWKPKLTANAERDARQRSELEDTGWTVVTVWECEVRNDAALSRAVELIKSLAGKRRRKSPAATHHPPSAAPR